VPSGKFTAKIQPGNYRQRLIWLISLAAIISWLLLCQRCWLIILLTPLLGFALYSAWQHQRFCPYQTIVFTENNTLVLTRLDGRKLYGRLNYPLWRHPRGCLLPMTQIPAKQRMYLLLFKDEINAEKYRELLKRLWR